MTKQTLLSLLLCILAMAGNAAHAQTTGRQMQALGTEGELASQSGSRAGSMERLEGTCALGSWSVAPAARTAEAKAATLPSEFTAAEFDHSYRNGTRSASAIVTVKAADATHATVSNLWNLGATLQATYDLTAGTVSITPAQVYEHSSYGPVWACPYNATTGTYSTTQPITGTIAADGTITLDAWGLFVTTGSSAGGYFGLYSKREFKATNATVSDVIYNGTSVTNTDSVLTYPAYIEQDYDNQVQIINLAQSVEPVNVRLCADTAVSIATQFVTTGSDSKDYYCYPAAWATSKSAQSGDIAGTVAGNVIALGNWGVFAKSSKSTSIHKVLSTKIEVGDGVITYPAVSSLTWSGDGSEASPYVITTPEQLLAFSDAVAAGNDFTGKHVQLGNDLDMGSARLAYQSIGSATNPFNGTFSGAGHTIKGLQISTSSQDYQGLFGYAGSESVIKNVTLDSAVVSTGGNYEGGVAGLSAGKISGITVSNSTFTFTGYIGGGVVGRFEGSELSDVSATATLNGAGGNGMVAGVIVGAAQASRLESHGSIRVTSVASTTYHGVGGLVGMTSPHSTDTPSLADSYNDAQIYVTASSAAVGGVVGRISSGTVQRCFNVGSVSGASYLSSAGSVGAIGGVAGQCYGGEIRDCYNGNLVMGLSYTDRIGGIVGQVMSPAYTISGGDTTKVTYQSVIVNSLNVGEVYQSPMYEKQGVCGSTYSDTVFHNSYFDQQMVGSIMPDATKWMAKTTSELTSGKAIDGFDTSVWTFTQGFYPRLKVNGANASALLGASPVTFRDGESVVKVKNTFKISTANDVYWKIYSSSTFVDETDGLAIEGDSVVVKNAYSNVILVGRGKSNPSLMKMLSVVTVNPASFQGSGTADDPYLVKTKADLIAIDEGVSQYEQSFKGDYFKQCNDIDIEGATDFQGIGTNDSYLRFDATYDGGGYAIHNLKADGVVNDASGKASSDDSKIAIGFIGFLGANGTIKNLTIASDCQFAAFNYAAGLAAVNYGTIVGCKNYAAVSVINQYAGVAGMADAGSRVEGCYNAGRIVTGTRYAAGIVAYSLGEVIANQNDGDIAGEYVNPYKAAGNQYSVAGITAYNGGTNVIKGNINTGAISATYKVGGISTQLSASGGTFAGNINYGTVSRTLESNANIGAVLSTAPTSANVVADNYYDGQILCFGAAASSTYSGLNDVNTSVLTGGKALDGLDASLYDFTAGLYPVLKAFKDEPAAVAHRKMVVTFADSQNANDMLTSATLNQSDDLQWSLKSGQYFSIDGATLQTKMTDKLTSLRDTLVATVGSYSKSIDLRAMPTVFEGSGTADDPFLIKIKDDMLKLAAFTNDELYPFNKRYFKVVNDIDFDTTTYVPVGVGSGSFNGYFDGNGKKFLNIVNVLATKTDASRGLFGNLGPDGSVHDLTLASGTITSYRYTGGIVGVAYGSVYNCENHASIVATSNGAGGIVGTVKDGGSVTGCKNYGNIAAASGQNGGIAYKVEAGGRIENCVNDTAITSAKTILGGITAYNGGSVVGCENRGALSGTSTVGGIVATSTGGDTIASCINTGAITATSNYVGGILGVNTKSTEPTVVTGCVNEATVSAKYLGGVIGRLYAGIVVEDCHNSGNLTGISSSNKVGGVIGDFSAASGYTSVMRRCYNTGAITATGNYTGGVLAYSVAGVEVYDCYNTGDINVTGRYVGGFAGCHSGLAVNCYNTGNVTATDFAVAGFSGLGSGELHGCFNLGDVTSTAGTSTSGVAGGLWGYGRANISDSYNMGTVTGPAYVGGITGGKTSSFSLTNSYNAGQVVVEDSVNRGSISPALAENDFFYTNVYYDTDVNPGIASPTDSSMAKGVSTRELTLTAINDSSFNVITGMYPTLKYQAQNAVANWFAAVPVFAEGESAEHICSFFVIGTPDSTEWTASDNLWINGNEVHGTAVGEAWITKTYGKFTKTYKLYVEVPSGVQDIDTNAQIVRTEYYTVSGMMLGTVRPTGTGVYVARDIYSNGAAQAHKLVVR